MIEAAVRVREGSVLSGAVMIALRTQKLGAFKTPDRIDFLPELPKGPSGKIRRLKLLELT
ncbi:hypothetical protein ABMC88_03925 [Sulfitobacter sp. HNIBRBA2951]|uniref:hypothetical protein n=1 Tax=Sulfitobacter aquimarinus TaxID=3158557 RepID=UPI0032DF87A5